MVEKLEKIISQSQNIVFFGGAGVSTGERHPGLPQWTALPSEIRLPARDDLESHLREERPEEFYRFYRDKLIVKGAKPNAAHLRLAKPRAEGRLKAVITQNIDGLHQAAGSKTVYELHGSTLRNYCVKCGAFTMWTLSPTAPVCRAAPDAVASSSRTSSFTKRGWMSRYCPAQSRAIRRADTLIIGGTSLVVYPAAGLIRYFRGDHLVVINMQPTNADAEADLCIAKPIGQVLSEDIVVEGEDVSLRQCRRLPFCL